MTGVAGLAGDPANPPRAPRPMPPLPLCSGTRRLAAAFDRLGWQLVAVRCGDRFRRPGRGAPGLQPLRPLRPHLSAPCPGLRRPDLLAGGAGGGHPPGHLCRGGADRDGPGNGHAVGATFRDAAGTWRFPAAGRSWWRATAMGTARLLLAWRPRAQPAGLANATGLVGRNLMHPPDRDRSPASFGGRNLGRRPAPCLRVPNSQEFYETDPQTRGAVRGYQLQALRGRGRGDGARLHCPRCRGAPGTTRGGGGLRPVVSLTVTGGGPAEPEQTVITLRNPVRRDRAGSPRPARPATGCRRTCRRCSTTAIERRAEAEAAPGGEVRSILLAARPASLPRHPPDGRTTRRVGGRRLGRPRRLPGCAIDAR